MAKHNGNDDRRDRRNQRNRTEEGKRPAKPPFTGLALMGEEAPNKILIKFGVGQDCFSIPVGIRAVGRKTDKQVDRENQDTAKVMGEADLGKVGRLRPGRTDTGEMVLEAHDTTLAGLTRTLRELGYVFHDVHYYMREIPVKQKHKQKQDLDKAPGPMRAEDATHALAEDIPLTKPAYTVVVGFARGEKPIKPDDEVMEYLKELANKIVWRSFYLWVNLDGNATINVSGFFREDEEEITRKQVFVDGARKLQCWSVEDHETYLYGPRVAPLETESIVTAPDAATTDTTPTDA